MGFTLHLPKKKNFSKPPHIKEKSKDTLISEQLRKEAVDRFIEMMKEARGKGDGVSIYRVLERFPAGKTELFKKKPWSLSDAIYMCQRLGMYLDISIENQTITINWEKTERR